MRSHTGRPLSRRVLVQRVLGLAVGSGALVLGCGGPAPGPSPAPTSVAAPTPAAATAQPAAAAATVAPAQTTGAPAQTSVAPAQATAAPGASVHARAAWVAKTANQMLWPLALDAGYFQQQGVSFDLSYLNGSNTAVAALLAKDLDMASVAGSAVVGAQAAGQDLVMVAGFLNQAVFRILSISLPSIDAVKGTTVGVTKIGNADYYVWQTIMARQQWAPTDLRFVNAGDIAGQVAMLQRGDVQAIALSPPNDVLATKVGAHLLLDTATLNEPEQNVGMVVTRAYLQGNRATVTSVLKASIEAIARWKQDAAFTKGVIHKYLQLDDPEVIQDGYDAYGPLWPQAPYPSRDGLVRVIQEVSAENPKAKDLNPDQLMDTSVVKELEDTGFLNSSRSTARSA